MNTVQALESLKMGAKVRGATWWHGRYLQLNKKSQLVFEDGQPANIAQLGDDWELYQEYPILEKFECAVWKSSKGVMFQAPVKNGKIDHILWNEITDPNIKKAAREVL